MSGISGRRVADGSEWTTFRAGHHGWYYVDDRCVARGPWKSEDEAKEKMELVKGEKACHTT